MTTLTWLMGRGISIACDLDWKVPNTWCTWDREVQVAMVKAAVRDAMDAPGVDTTCLRTFLKQLASRTAPTWNHRFVTTNWDWLLQRELLRLVRVVPAWLDDSHVLHLNGTVEEPETPDRSPFILETDLATVRVQTLEGNKAFNHMMWQTHFVVVGMSFECEMDRFLLWSLQHVQDEMPIGESRWILVNPDPAALAATGGRIKSALPSSSIVPIAMPFTDWLKMGLDPLPKWGVFRPSA
jgi:hypothetical protein